MKTVGDYRIEKDTMGDVKVPSWAYWGAQTQRAVDNFPISSLRFSKDFIRALALVKLAAAKANMQLGLLDEKKGNAIVSAAKEVMEGSLYEHFVVDVFQTGSGTSTNMNMNEVLANRAIELLGGERGQKGLIHPNDHVNMGQSTNDVFPSSIHIAAAEAVTRKLLPSLQVLAKSLDSKAKEFEDIVKAGRTYLQDYCRQSNENSERSPTACFGASDRHCRDRNSGGPTGIERHARQSESGYSRSGNIGRSESRRKRYINHNLWLVRTVRAQHHDAGPRI